MTSKLGMKLNVLTLGVAALGLIAVPPAFSASKAECLGGRPNVIGTKGNDVIKVYADEAGPQATVNGQQVKIPYGPLIIFGDKGNDRITYSQDGGGPARVCGGDGKDTISGVDFTRIHGGGGYDTVEVYDQCGWGSEIFAVEAVRTKAAVGEAFDEGPCN